MRAMRASMRRMTCTAQALESQQLLDAHSAGRMMTELQ